MQKLPRLKLIPNLIHGFSEKTDGNMSFKWGRRKFVRKHREEFLSDLSIEPERCVVMEVSHGLDIAAVGENEAGRGIFDPSGTFKADALITDQKNVFLFLLTGDCLPAIFYDPKKSAVGLAHLSWMNSGKKFAGRVVSELYKKYGSNPNDLLIGIGPGIHKESYIFPSSEIQNRSPDWENFLRELPGGKASVDLVGYNVHELIRAGVLEKNVEVSDIDTGCDYSFFSHYRSKRTGELEGRMATVAGENNLTSSLKVVGVGQRMKSAAKRMLADIFARPS